LNFNSAEFLLPGMLKKTKKTQVIDDFRVHASDTGSAAVQVALLTEQIKQLTKHLKKHVKDNHSRYGLLKMVAKRKKFLDYLKRTDEPAHKNILKKLELKK